MALLSATQIRIVIVLVNFTQLLLSTLTNFKSSRAVAWLPHLGLAQTFIFIYYVTGAVLAAFSHHHGNVVNGVRALRVGIHYFIVN